MVGPSWVGDMVMAQSLLITLKQHNPDCCIDVLAPGWSKPLLERMPEVANAINMSVGHGQLDLGARWKLGRELGKRGYSQAILLPNSMKSALVPFWADIPKRTGWVGEMRYGLLNDVRKLDKSHFTMTVQRFVALAFPREEQAIPEIPTPKLQIDQAIAEQAMQDLGLGVKQRPVLALCPGAEYGPAKRWPEAHYAGLAAKMVDHDWDVWLFGSAKDQPVCAEILESVGEHGIDLSGRTSLAQAVDLLSQADAVVSNDSGLMHVAAALDRPLVAIYGSSDPGFTPPLNSRSRVLSLGLECSPCFKRECPKGHLECLTGITVDQVQSTLDELL
ncbi:ADP-heptose--lipooligosaccharide heptosyltransferase II [hydrothermal vent metagenome]|uniref:lipopolysaccharide heptosyltransferase II n=1 Tax=hydrothermal vent metagenome TaxID=652676 RepID=A0A3B1B5H5_9ZZZZ